MAGIDLHPRIAIEFDGITGILDLVADAAGCAVLSMNAVTTAGQAAVLTTRPIMDPTLRSRLALAVSATVEPPAPRGGARTAPRRTPAELR